MKYKFIDIIILLILFSILIYKIIIFFSLNNKSYNKSYNEKFENLIPTTTFTNETIINTKSSSNPSITSNTTAISIPTDVETNCNADNNVIGYCINYNGCCTQNITVNNDCYCKHPIVQKCKKIFDECITNKENNNCKDKLKECCIDYNKINIDSSYFNKPIKQEQQSKMICSISSTNNIEQKCMELCQTTPECKSYSVNTFNCMLFNDIDPIQQKQGLTPITDYYIKKS
jgi:hypothetical protein